MKIKMLSDARGSIDGINSRAFAAGEVCEINDELGNVFVNEMQVAVLANDSNDSKKPIEPKVESKALDTPENKAIDSAPENKSKKVK